LGRDDRNSFQGRDGRLPAGEGKDAWKKNLAHIFTGESEKIKEGKGLEGTIAIEKGNHSIAATKRLLLSSTGRKGGKPEGARGKRRRNLRNVERGERERKKQARMRHKMSAPARKKAGDGGRGGLTKKSGCGCDHSC